MTRLTLFISLFVFVATLFFSASSVLAQGAALIQGDYKAYERFFTQGKDPNFSTSETWRRNYLAHRWSDYAAGTEYRDPILEAQTLTGIYLTSYVDAQLFHQIESIIISKAALGAVLSEKMTLDLIGDYLERSEDEKITAKINAAGSEQTWYSQMELNKQWMLNRNVEEEARKRIVSGRGISDARWNEIKSTRALFTYAETDWDSIYYFVRERINLLNDLADHFPFNWELDSENMEAALEKLMTDPKLRMEIEKEIKDEDAARRSAATGTSLTSSSSGSSSYSSDSSSSSSDYSDSTSYTDTSMLSVVPIVPTGMTQEEIEAEVDKRLPLKAQEKLAANNERYRAFKYIVGIYQSSDYHMETLQRIHRYYENAAKSGDPIAQYHLSIFLRHLGDIVDPYAEDGEHLSESQKWLDRARLSPVTKARVAKLEGDIAETARKQTRRDNDYLKKSKALIKTEEDKIDLYEDILIGVRERIGNSGGGMMGGMYGGGYGSGSGNSGYGNSSGGSSGRSRNSNSGSSSSSSSP